MMREIKSLNLVRKSFGKNKGYVIDKDFQDDDQEYQPLIRNPCMNLNGTSIKTKPPKKRIFVDF